MNFQTFFDHLINGLSLGGMYALIALGYTMVYGIVELINFAHGEVFMIGAFIGLLIANALLGPAVLPPIIVLLLMFAIAMAFTSCLGFTMEKLAYKPLRNRPRITLLLSAIGMSIFLSNLVSVYAKDKVNFPQLTQFIGARTASEAVLQLGPNLKIPYIAIMIISTSIVMMILLHLFIQNTRRGKAMRAVAQDRTAAKMMGVNVNTTISLTFVIGSALAAAGGIMHGLKYGSIKFSMGYLAGLKAFAAAVLGGIGNIRGAMIGGFILGLSETVLIALLATLFLALAGPEISNEVWGYKDVAAFLILILTLMIKPSGIMGKSEPEKI